MHFSLLSESGLSLMDFAAQRDYYTLKHKQIMIARDVEDTEQHIHRKGEDELRRTKREAENNELRDIEKMIEDKELILYQHFKRQKGVLLRGKTCKSTNISPNSLGNNQYNSPATSSSNYLDTKIIGFYRSPNEDDPEQEHLEQEHLEQEHLEQEHLEQEHLEQEHLEQESTRSRSAQS